MWRIDIITPTGARITANLRTMPSEVLAALGIESGHSGTVPIYREHTHHFAEAVPANYRETSEYRVAGMVVPAGRQLMVRHCRTTACGEIEYELHPLEVRSGSIGVGGHTHEMLAPAIAAFVTIEEYRRTGGIIPADKVLMVAHCADSQNTPDDGYCDYRVFTLEDKHEATDTVPSHAAQWEQWSAYELDDEGLGIRYHRACRLRGCEVVQYADRSEVPADQR